MTAFDLAAGLPEDLKPETPLYLLGAGGPEDESGIGRPETFVWRLALLEGPEGPPVALAFRAMPQLMRFTRELNQRQPFSVPTEAQRRPAGELAGARLALLLDPRAEDFLTLAGGAELLLRRVAELER